MALELLIGTAWYVGHHTDPTTSKGDTAMMGSDALSGVLTVESLTDRLRNGAVRDGQLLLVDLSPVYSIHPRDGRASRSRRSR